MSIEITSPTVDFAMTHGVVFELNRRALHPRGLHMVGDPESNKLVIRRYDDDHGPYYSDADMVGAEFVADAFDALELGGRYDLYGWMEQPRDWEGGS